MVISKKRSGFTLIELIFVILLVALITTVAIPRVSSQMGLNIRSNVLRVSGFMQTAYQQAVLSHQKIRLNFNLEDGSYWAENYVEPQTIPLINETTELDDILNTFRKRAEEDDDEELAKQKEAEKFQKIENDVLKPAKIDSSLKFKALIFPGKQETNTQGVVSFFISGSGVNDQVILYISHGDDSTYSVIFPPITGKPRVEKGEIDAKDL